MSFLLSPRFLPANSTDALDTEVARSSMAVRAHQSISARWVIWLVCAVTVFSLHRELSLYVTLGWAVPVALMAEVNWRVSRQVLAGLADAAAPSLRQRQFQLWWMTAINQSLMATTVWWLGSSGDLGLAALGTTLQLVYLTAAMINAGTHPATFVAGAWINLLSATVYWSTHGELKLPLGLALLGLGLMVTRLSTQMAKSFRDSLSMRFQNKALVDQLQIEKQVAQEATAFKSTFISNISHEIRTPLSAMGTMAFLLLKSDLTPRQRDQVNLLHQSNQHLGALVSQVLDFSKMEAHMLQLDHREFNLRTVLDNVHAMHESAATAKGLQLGLNVAPGTPERLVGDSVRLSEILINLLSNAIKFTENGFVRLDIEPVKTGTGRIQLKCSVHDSGIGINAEQMARLFQSFSQADPSISRQYGGTGLGLAIIKMLAELMEGEVGVHSDVGVGSVFWCLVWLDLADADGLTAHDAPEPSDEMDWTHTLPPDWPTDQAAAPAPDPALALDGSAQAQLCHHLAWLAAQDSPRALDLLDTHADALTTRLGSQFAPVARAIHRLQLPLAQRLLHSLGYEGQTPPAGMPNPGDTQRPCVLVVDDTPVNLTMMTDLLQDEHCVRVALSGERALAIAQSPQPPDLILLDVMMPGMDGFEVITRLKANPATARIPVVFLTAMSRLEDEEKGLSLGAADFIAKPISPPIVMTRVRTQLKLKAAQDLLSGTSHGAESTA